MKTNQQKTLCSSFAEPRFWGAAIACAIGLSFVTVIEESSGATSTIVGHYPISVPAGNSAWVSGLVCADVFEGAAVSVTADTDGKALVTFDSPGWVGTEFPLHYAEPQTGTASGLAVDILSTTASTLKLDVTPAEAGISAGMVFIVRKHVTLAGILPTGGGLIPFSDSISLITGPGTQASYFYHGTSQKWITAQGADANNVKIRPGQGLIIQAGSAVTLVIGRGEACYVKATPTRVRLSAGVSNLVGALNPLGSTTTLGALGLTSGLQPFNDSLVVLNPGPLSQSGTYLSNGANLINSGGQNANGTALPTGASVVVNVDTAKSMVLAPVQVAP